MLPFLLTVAALLAPVAPAQIIAPYRPPASAYGPGHRGLDLAATVRQPVISPLDGVVAFVGTVNDRSVVSIRNGAMVVSLEPVDAVVAIGSPVDAGAPIGITGIGGHCSLRCIHIGVRVNGAYVDPLLSRRRLLRY